MIIYLSEELPYLETPLHTATRSVNSLRSSQANFCYTEFFFCKPEIFTVKVNLPEKLMSLSYKINLHNHYQIICTKELFLSLKYNIP